MIRRNFLKAMTPLTIMGSYLLEQIVAEDKPTIVRNREFDGPSEELTRLLNTEGVWFQDCVFRIHENQPYPHHSYTAKFTGCTFLTHPYKKPTIIRGHTFYGESLRLTRLLKTEGVHFEGCSFRVARDQRHPFSSETASFSGCTFWMETDPNGEFIMVGGKSKGLGPVDFDWTF